jgi:hypothetical protein
MASRAPLAFAAIAAIALVRAGLACTSYAAAECGTADAGDAATTDATPADATGEGGRYCERLDPKPTFCRDFDDEAPLFFGFSSRRGEDGGVVAFDTTTSASPPSSFALTLPAGPLPNQNGFHTLSIVHDIARPAPATSARFGFDLRVDHASGEIPVRTATFCNETAGGYCAWLAVFDGGAQLVEQTFLEAGIETKTHALGLPLAVGEWTRVEFTFTLAPAPGITLTFDGYDTMPGDLPYAIAAASGTASFGLNAIVYGQPGSSIPAIEIRYDNVVVDLK